MSNSQTPRHPRRIVLLRGRDEEFRDVQKKRREEVKRSFQEALEKITELMLSTYKFFESHPNDIQKEWRLYVEKLDKRVEEALKKALSLWICACRPLFLPCCARACVVTSV